ncbi:MAG: Gfo/Idh/MocA family oxidoreductase [Betaproteobacteria bacterium]|nr:Gfo/Idh/MocA family oxidoreductase [Betaproteobacteria bacterium]
MSRQPVSGRLRVASAGAGYFSRFHLEGWRAISGVEHVALCDSDGAKARALAQRFGIPEAHTDAAQMLDAVRPDIFDIVTPPPTHHALVAAAAERGIFAVCQKPLAPDYAQALAVVETAERAGTELVVHENFRFMPWFREAKSLIGNGTLGALHAVAFRLRPGDGQGPVAYLDRQPYFQGMPRLLVYETAIHYIDTFRYLMGEVSAVSARLRRMNPAIAGEDAGYIVFEFEGGATGLFDGNRLNDHVAANPRRTLGEMWLEGSNGVLRLDGDARLYWKPHRGPEAEHPYERGPETGFGGGACEALQRHVVRHLREGGSLENRARDYLVNLKVQEAVYRSHDTSRRVELAGFDPVCGKAPAR